MSIRDLLGAVGRRWYVVIIVLIAAAFLFVLLYRDGGSFSTRTIVTFTLPERTAILPESGTSDESVIAFAGAVATEINKGRPVPTYSSVDAPFYGAGLRQGVVVGLRNSGNQWISSFPSATIEIQIVGRTREWVELTQATLVEEILAVTEAQQQAVVTSPADRITARVDPLTMQIIDVVPGRNSAILAAGALAAAALIVSTFCAVAADRFAFRHRSRVTSARGPRPVRRVEGRAS